MLSNVCGAISGFGYPVDLSKSCSIFFENSDLDIFTFVFKWVVQLLLNPASVFGTVLEKLHGGVGELRRESGRRDRRVQSTATVARAERAGARGVVGGGTTARRGRVRRVLRGGV